ncbi:sel1 repeat family protein [Kribbella antibiotica]|uniref:Sel1 repeat family protein n=1 Tax=Kribbella antibiotica TaxID=190195 RepID=A0A4R4YSX7_9ACTN|nr:sel1 repeat family protein [Kribbella antibiotica]TDD46692.1 sel1 repeat family protein [Kribbella antibiotica]
MAGILAFVTLTLAVVSNVVQLITGNSIFLWICAGLYPIGLIFGALEWAERRARFRTPVGANVAEVRELGLEARGAGDKKAAERLLQVAAERGDVEAMWQLATVLLERDGRAAQPWLERAAAKGHPMAQMFLNPGN